MNDFGHVVPVFNVRDVSDSLDYYVNKLGFTKDWDWGKPPTFASVSRGKTRIYFCRGAQGNPGTWVWIPVSNVDELFNDFQSHGVLLRQPPTNFPWGSREMNVQDPDGNRIRFASDSTGESDGTPLMED